MATTWTDQSANKYKPHTELAGKANLKYGGIWIDHVRDTRSEKLLALFYTENNDLVEDDFNAQDEIYHVELFFNDLADWFRVTESVMQDDGSSYLDGSRFIMNGIEYAVSSYDVDQQGWAAIEVRKIGKN